MRARRGARPAIVVLAGAAISGGALAFAFPEPSIAPLAWVGLVPLLLWVSDTPPRRALVRGIVFGAGFFGVLLAWISIVGWLAWVLLVGLQALFLGAFALSYSWVARALRPLERVLAAGALWVAFDVLRASAPLGGFTWGQLAQSQHDLSWLLRLAGLGGGWLVTFAIVAVNALVAEAIRWMRVGRALTAAAYVGLAAVVLAAPLAIPAPEPGGRGLRVAIVQGNVPRNFAGPLLDKELGIIRRHQRLTQDLAGGAVDLVVWPESSVGLDLERVPQAGAAVADAARTVAAPMIVGGNLDAGPGRYLVMAFQISSEGQIVDRYQKTHLVPFGEYVPARAWLDWLPQLEQVPRDAIAGRDPVVFEVAGGRVAPVISFEGDFGSLVRARIAAGGRLLVVATNTSTWQRSWASAQHLAFSQVRAAENGVWVVHAALSGVSAFVGPDGQLTATTPLWRSTSLIEEVSFARDITPYARVGEWLPLACMLISLLALARATFVRRRPLRLG